MFQSTPPRRGRRINGLSFLILKRVSIHAPAQGATALAPVRPTKKRVSIHAPAQGATFTQE